MTFYTGLAIGVIIGAVCGCYLALCHTGKLVAIVLNRLVEDGLITKGGQ
jgi:hypothetical protein